MSNLTPMMQQYFEIKNQHKDCILFFRLGDFFEMFFDDAITASRELEITLTGRDCGQEERAPMCGVPFHAADNYIARLISKGYKVAICEQTEDPAQAKGIVRREVIKIVTPGTVTDSAMLDEKKNNYMMSLYKRGECFGIAAVDITTGEFFATQIYFGSTFVKLIDEIAKYSPSEILVNEEINQDNIMLKKIKTRFNAFYTLLEDRYFYNNNDFNGIHIEGGKQAIELGDISLNAAAALLKYIKETQKVPLNHVSSLKIYNIDEFMTLDYSTRRNLELTESLREKGKKGTLLWILDKTLTSAGGRLLRNRVEQPLIRTEDIIMRLDAVEELKDKYMIRVEIREYLKRIYDIERLTGKIVLGNANGRDLIALKNSLLQIPYIKELLANCQTSAIKKHETDMETLEDIATLIDQAICDEPLVGLKDGGIIKTGYNGEIDTLRDIGKNGKIMIASIENNEREKTGIKNLKVGFNRVFGYFIEITRSYFDKVPEEYIRKQTLANCERFITQELKELEEKILGAGDKLLELEYNIFIELRNRISEQAGRLKKVSACIAEIDFYASLAETAEREGYCKPQINDSDALKITDGRHPVIEKVVEEGAFVPNDTFLDEKEDMVSIITGPNMAGKSTYMRQVALIVLMAQMGSFVPASAAIIGVVDRIFTRVGASDDLASGQSTFMVEMAEVANITKNSTQNSLIILDEIGRGTSTFDGLSIAWAVTEFISSRIKARTLLATHYHELTELEGKLPGVKNYCISVKKNGDDIIFMHKIIRGGADGSYGIHVAILAGIPAQVTDRAKEILKELEESDISMKASRIKKRDVSLDGQMDLMVFGSILNGKDEILNDVKNVNLQGITPIEALNFIYKLQQKIKDLV